MNKAVFLGNQGKLLSEQTYEELYNEAENLAFKQGFEGTEDEIDEQENEFILSYLDDCYQAAYNVPCDKHSNPINFHQWLDWLQYGYFKD